MVNVRCTTDTSELCNTEKSRSKESIFFRICLSFCTVFPLFLNFPYPVNHFPNHEKELSLFLLTKSRKMRSACSICFIKHNSYEIKEALEFSFQSGDSIVIRHISFKNAHHLFFFHPDYTVGFGIAPNHALRLVGFTTGGEFRSALKTLCFLWVILLHISIGKSSYFIHFAQESAHILT